ncbi:MAG: CRISPR-associated endonuclease Cas2 [Clostridia bacterium]|nr:CRISPR-associated endonuclease Cas2 [Clostridia bacterium]
MSEKRGVILLLFDLPCETKKQRRAYAAFRKFIRSNGYVFIQKSVYCKPVCSHGALKSELKRISSAAPEDGNVAALPLGYAAFMQIKTISGEGYDIERLFAETLYF